MTVEIAVFARAPVPGRAKRRLIPALGEEGAADLQRRMTDRAVAAAVAARAGPVSLWCTPDRGHPSFRDLACRHPIRLRVQEGRDLGERMGAAMRHMLVRGSCALLAGSDCPRLGAGEFRQAAEWLEAGTDAVLAPALDGGYVLIGLRRYEASLFAGMDWGTDRVLSGTRRRLRELGWGWRETEPLPDVDRPSDLVHLEAGTDPLCVSRIESFGEKLPEARERDDGDRKRPERSVR